MPPAADGRFDRCNLRELSLQRERAHDGDGLIGFRRVADGAQLAGECNFIDYAVLPRGVSIGRHRHASQEEEFYLILEGEGTMWRDGESFPVCAGDLIRNAPGGSHGLVNSGQGEMRIFVFELGVGR